jgi:hypothetical protein
VSEGRDDPFPTGIPETTRQNRNLKSERRTTMGRKVRGYGGWYNGVYLRSSLEFAYAYYLDHIGVKWLFEKELFHIGSTTYKPDFFLYDDTGNLTKIVEMKGEGNFKQGEEKVMTFRTKVTSRLRSLPTQIFAEYTKTKCR